MSKVTGGDQESVENSGGGTGYNPPQDQDTYNYKRQSLRLSDRELRTLEKVRTCENYEEAGKVIPEGDKTISEGTVQTYVYRANKKLDQRANQVDHFFQQQASLGKTTVSAKMLESALNNIPHHHNSELLKDVLLKWIQENPDMLHPNNTTYDRYQNHDDLMLLRSLESALNGLDGLKVTVQIEETTDE